MNRDTFLAAVRQSLKTAHLPDVPAQPPIQPLPPPMAPADLLDTFTASLIALKAEVYHAADPNSAQKIVAGIFAFYHAATFISWDADHLPLPGLLPRLAELGISRRPVSIPTDETRPAVLDDLATIPIGITGAEAGLANTGSLVLTGGPGKSKLASLLPPIHIALLPINRLYSSPAHFIRAQPQAARQTANLLFITGPSRTADIEQTLTLGVHGPKHLHVIIYDRR